MGKLVLAALLLVIVLPGIFCPPVTKSPGKKDEEPAQGGDDEEMNFGLEYERYLKEVVNILETDEVFKKKLEESNISDIKSGAIARHLEFVSHAVRSKLDELKRQEMDRLRQLMRIKTRNKMGIPSRDLERMIGHLDNKNQDTFEESDLAMLVKKATKDLEDIDLKRKEEFKTYEMEKEHLKREKLKALKEEERKAEEQRLKDLEEKHKKHPKLHHPGSKDQLEEVWEEADGLSKDDFDPKTFFMLHDTNSDGIWDETEVEALFQRELDKMYDPDAPEDDMMERYEEMNRMREHVMKEVDKNQDKMITMEEFIQNTKNGEFEKDDGWEGLDEDDDLFSEDELAAFEREYEQRRMGQFQEGHVQPGEVNYQHGQGQPDGQQMQFQPHDQFQQQQQQLHEQQQPVQQQQQQQQQFGQGQQHIPNQQQQFNQQNQQQVHEQQQQFQHHQGQQPVQQQQQFGEGQQHIPNEQQQFNQQNQQQVNEQQFQQNQQQVNAQQQQFQQHQQQVDQQQQQVGQQQVGQQQVDQQQLGQQQVGQQQLGQEFIQQQVPEQNGLNHQQQIPLHIQDQQQAQHLVPQPPPV